MPLILSALPAPLGLSKTQLERHLLQEDFLNHTQPRTSPLSYHVQPHAGIFRRQNVSLIEASSSEGRAQGSLTELTDE